MSDEGSVRFGPGKCIGCAAPLPPKQVWPWCAGCEQAIRADGPLVGVRRLPAPSGGHS
jgi:hypothetical protein